MKNKVVLTICILIAISAISVSILMRLLSKEMNERPTVYIYFPKDGGKIHGILTITGVSRDIDGKIESVELKIDNGPWGPVNGTYEWSYVIDTRDLDNGYHEIFVRAWDGFDYSDVTKISISVENVVSNNVHRWALFAAAANVAGLEVKLGNGVLKIAEDMARYFISDLNYPESHVTILFDDGWIRDKNGEGDKIMTLQERDDKIRFVSYGPATKDYFVNCLKGLIEDANRYNDSEVFIWISGHGIGDPNRITGGKILRRSEVILWDGTLRDRELGDILKDLNAKLCIIIDSCYSGGFANRIIFDIPSLLRSGIPRDGRIVITGESKLSIGYASNMSGPLFTQLWFDGLKTGRADGFRRGMLGIARKSTLGSFKDGKVSVEEAFYYAKYMIRKEYKEFIWMQPQMNDMYPNNFPFNRGEMFLVD